MLHRRLAVAAVAVGSRVVVEGRSGPLLVAEAMPVLAAAVLHRLHPFIQVETRTCR